jgi:hypothetical protein
MAVDLRMVIHRAVVRVEATWRGRMGMRMRMGRHDARQIGEVRLRPSVALAARVLCYLNRAIDVFLLQQECECSLPRAFRGWKESVVA